MTFSLLFAHPTGEVSLLQATAVDGAVERWTATTILNTPVTLSASEKWLAAVYLAAEARRLQVTT